MIPEIYTCIAISTAHLSDHHKEYLSLFGGNMVMERDTGFFIKLYAESEHGTPPIEDDLQQALGRELTNFLHLCRSQGYLLIEFDSDADCCAGLTTYDGNQPEPTSCT